MRLAAAAIAVPLALVFLFASPAFADQTVDDETGLMSSAAVAQIDARNKQLADATGRIVAVVVVRTASDLGAAADAIASADKFAKGKYGAIVWVATGSERSDIVYSGRASKWVLLEEQSALRTDLNGNLRYCCPSETIPGVVDKLATAMEAGSKVPPSSRNYVHDEIGLLGGDQVASIVAREDKVEAATGKGVGVVIFPAQPGKQSGLVAFSMAQSANVKGDVAAIVWVANNGSSYDFNMLPSLTDNSIPETTSDSINRSFQADMQTGKFGDAIVAAVDRTASALEATSTPLPSPNVTPQESASPAGGPGESAAPVGQQTAQPRPATSGSGTVVLIFLAFAIILFIVIMALRRRNY